jgi:hypothetical protein
VRRRGSGCGDGGLGYDAALTAADRGQERMKINFTKKEYQTLVFAPDAD